MSLKLTVELRRPTAVRPTPTVCRVASMFGLGVDEDRTLTIVPSTDLTLRAGQIVYLTGVSGGGKSSLLHLIRRCAAEQGATVIDLDDALPAGDASLVDLLVDRFALPLHEALSLLSLAGLADAFVMLRSPGELSDGQRFRFRFACAMAGVSRTPGFGVLVADEFASTLDRRTAATVAGNVQRWSRRCDAGRRACLVLATAHDDLLDALQPDMIIDKGPGDELDIARRPATKERR